MAEAEDVITDAARHATVFVQRLWRRHLARAGSDIHSSAFIAQRLNLLLIASFDTHFRVLPGQVPAPVPLLRRIFRRHTLPLPRTVIPATDGASIWLPLRDNAISATTLRVLSMQQAARAKRGAAHALASEADPLVRAVFEVLQADAADAQLIRQFPGIATHIVELRQRCLSNRPPLESLPLAHRRLESWLRDVLRRDADESQAARSCQETLLYARTLCREQAFSGTSVRKHGIVLLRDDWTGELRDPADTSKSASSPRDDQKDKQQNIRSAHLRRRPRVRPPDPRDEERAQGAWMVQTAQPHEHAEDPFGMQRPTDRDEHQAAEELADSVAELTEARLVNTPTPAREVLLSDEPPATNARVTGTSASTEARVLRYPEWDWRAGAYRHPGAAIHVLDTPLGSREWVVHTLDRHRTLLRAVRRQFESLRAQRLRLRQQVEGADLDLQACVDAMADIRAGTAIERGLYQTERTTTRDLAMLLLIDVSGSTDGWVSQHRRVIDVEREALLLVCQAMDTLGEPYSVLAFSGKSAERVTVRLIKDFAERNGEQTSLRIAGLEPELYTRAGTAIRHASQLLMRQPARHRLLLLLSDGKPNDEDGYDGRYGVEDMRQSIIEARLQGIFPFCLTIDRHVASYLPAVFGKHQYAVLHQPDVLPAALLGWLRRLVQQ